LWLFFVPVSLAVAEESGALASARAADFFFLDFLLEVPEVVLSSVAPASFFDFFVSFFVVVVSVLGALELACALARAGIDITTSRHNAAIHLVSLMGSLFIWVLMFSGALEPAPGLWNSEVRGQPADAGMGRGKPLAGLHRFAGSHHASPVVPGQLRVTKNKPPLQSEGGRANLFPMRKFRAA
jgi:hypothetical protein